MNDLLGTSPDSIPLFWQWAALIVGFIGTGLGLALSIAALFIVFKSQPNFRVDYAERTEGQRTVLEIIPQNHPQYGWLSRKLGIRRIVTQASVMWVVQDLVDGTSRASGMVEDRTYPATRVALASVIVEMVMKGFSPVAFAHASRGNVILSPNTYRFSAVVLEEGQSKSIHRDFLIGTSINALKWL